MAFKKANKYECKLRMALLGPAGSGKTYTALKLASFLGEKIAVIDTEKGSASKYSDIFEFDVDELEIFSADRYIDAIKEAENMKYDVLVIDSLSHAWSGKGGILDFVEIEKTKSRTQNSFTDGWRKATPKHNELVEKMLRSSLHLIVTMRVKMEYVIEEDEKTHKKVPKKIGLAPVQRNDLEYEFDIVGDMDLENNFIESKTRCHTLKGKVFPEPGKDLADIISAWLKGESRPDIPILNQPKPEQNKAPSGNGGNGNGGNGGNGNHKNDPMPLSIGQILNLYLKLKLNTSPSVYKAYLCKLYQIDDAAKLSNDQLGKQKIILENIKSDIDKQSFEARVKGQAQGENKQPVQANKLLDEVEAKIKKFTEGEGITREVFLDANGIDDLSALPDAQLKVLSDQLDEYIAGQSPDTQKEIAEAFNE